MASLTRMEARDLDILQSTRNQRQSGSPSSESSVNHKIFTKACKVLGVFWHGYRTRFHSKAASLALLS